MCFVLSLPNELVFIVYHLSIWWAFVFLSLLDKHCSFICSHQKLLGLLSWIYLAWSRVLHKEFIDVHWRAFKVSHQQKGIHFLQSLMHLILVCNGYQNLKACLCFIAMWGMMVSSYKHCVHYVMDLFKLNWIRFIGEYNRILM